MNQMKQALSLWVHLRLLSIGKLCSVSAKALDRFPTFISVAGTCQSRLFICINDDNFELAMNCMYTGLALLDNINA